MRKGDLIAAIKENQSGKPAKGEKPEGGQAKSAVSAKANTPGNAEAPAAAPAPARAEQGTLDVSTAPAKETPVVEAAAPAKESAPVNSAPAEATPTTTTESTEDSGRDGGQRGRGRQRRGRDQARSGGGETATADARGDEPKQDTEQGERRRERNQSGERNQSERNQGERSQSGERNQGERNQGERNQSGDRAQSGERNQSGERGQSGERNNQNGNGGGNANGGRNNDRNNARNNNDDDEGDGRGRRGRRFRERRRGRDRETGGGGGEARELEIRDDDVLQPVAGILDVLDNYAFVRTSGYLAGPNDVYVSMNLVRKNGLRRGDAITGAVRAPRDGEQNNQRQKFDPLVRLDTVNGGDVEDSKRRPEFSKLTPLYPNQRLRLETQQNKLTTRVIDLIMPIGKGQRALIVSPPKAGKTTIMQDIANAIAINNPEVYLMVVLVDERPEEVTDMQRSVKGEVIASTFDRPPGDHTSVAELAIERAKRLVEMGKDVVVLLDSITRLGRAYNNSSPASGRILSGGVDSTALYPPKRFLGAARNIENGGSLTIIATAMVETGSTGDTVIFEEFKGTGNAELKLDRKIAERRVFPAVDVNPSGTRKDELLLNPDEAAVLHKLRRVLSGLDSHQAIDLLIDRLKKSKNNLEFLMQVSKTAPGALDE